MGNDYIDPTAQAGPEINPWPNGPDEHRQFWILSIGINCTGQDAGDIDYCINTSAVEYLRRHGRLSELFEVIESLKNSCSLSPGDIPPQ